MPKTTLERIFFTTTGVILMATTMVCVNKSIVMGGFSSAVIAQIPSNFLLRAPLAWIAQFFFVSRFAGKMADRYPSDNKLVYYAIRTGFSELLMCPLMSFYSNIIYLGLKPEFFYRWIQMMFLNWPFAFLVQIFFAGPVNRLIFSLVFRRKAKA